MPNAALVALLTEAAAHADTSAGLDESMGAVQWAEESRALATRLRTAADALAGEASLLDRVAACKGFDVGYHFMVPEWVVNDLNFDDAEYRGATLTDALTALANAYAARAATEG